MREWKPSLLTSSHQFLSKSALVVITSICGTLLCLPSADNVQHTDFHSWTIVMQKNRHACDPEISSTFLCFVLVAFFFSCWKWLRISIHLLRRRYLPVLPLFRMQICHRLFSASLFIMLTLFPPSILPLFVMSELVMNFMDFLGFFGDEKCTVVLTKCCKLLSLRTSWQSGMVLLWSWKGFGKNTVEETLHCHSSRFERKFGKTSQFSPCTEGEFSWLLSLTLVPVVYERAETALTPG